MKNFVKFIVCLFVISLVSSCEYDDKFIIDEHDGKDGKDAPIMYKHLDETNNVYITWLDRNWDKKLSLPADTILYREDKEGTKYVQVGSCIQVTQLIGLKVTFVGSVCNGSNGTNGLNGANGNNGLNGTPGKSISIKITPIPDKNNPNIVLGNEVAFYSDEDNDGVVSTSDIWRNTLIVPNGKNGEMGQTGPIGPIGPMGPAGLTPIITGEYANDSLFITFTVGTDITKFGIPKVYSISVQATQTSLGVIYLLYYDKNGNKKYDAGDVWLAENLIKNGEQGQQGQPGVNSPVFACFTKSYDTQGDNANYFNSTDFVLNGFVYSEWDGALYLDKSYGYILFPSLVKNNGLLLLTFNYGSKKSYDFVVKAIYSDNTKAVIKKVHMEGNPSFNKNVYDTYSLFEYRASDFSNLQFKNVKRIEIEVTLFGKCVPEYFYVDNYDSVFGI